MDGFAKLHSFKFDGTKVYFSGKMIESSTYKDTLKAGEYVPQTNLGKFINPNDEWSIFEMGQIFLRIFHLLLGNALHNNVSFNITDYSPIGYQHFIIILRRFNT